MAATSVAKSAANAPAAPTATNATPAPPGPRWRRRVRAPRTALLLLAVVSALSLATRAAWIGDPPTPVFDENYYVNAARTIAGIPVPHGAAYSGASPHLDPNYEHPPLAKVLVAAGIRLFGDRPLGWRAASLVFGSLAVLALYWLVRGVGGSSWLALGAASILAADNLFLVHGRLATLDVFAVTLMLAGAGLYVRHRPVATGVALGLAGCTKLVGLYALGALALLELLRWRWPAELAAGPASSGGWQRLRPYARRLAICVVVTAVSFGIGLALLDARYTVFDSPLTHLRYMLGYAGNLPPHPPAHPGIAFAPTSMPWEWLLNRKAILYYQRLAPGSGSVLVQFQGRLSPFVIFLAVPALLAAGHAALRRRDAVAQLALAWTVATFGAFFVVSLDHRFNYLYYMLAVLPGICIALARVPSGRRWAKVAVPVYAVALLFELVVMFPVHTWSGA